MEMHCNPDSVMLLFWSPKVLVHVEVILHLFLEIIVLLQNCCNWLHVTDSCVYLK